MPGRVENCLKRGGEENKRKLGPLYSCNDRCSSSSELLYSLRILVFNTFFLTVVLYCVNNKFVL